MKKTLAILALIVLAVPAVAQTYNADAEYLSMRYEYTLNPDGSTVKTYSHTLRMITGFAFNRAYGESFIVYNPEWQTLKVTKSVTKMTDGREVESPYNAYNEVQPGFAHNIAPYNKLREMVVTHTGLEPGAVVTFEYTLTTKPGFLPGLMDRVLLAQRSPINNLEVVVRVPAGMNLAYEVQPFVGADPQKTSGAGQDIYTWLFKELPLVAVEDNQPGMWQFCPALTFSTAGEAQLAAHVANTKSMYDLNSPVKTAAAKAVEGITDPVKKAYVLQQFLLDRVAVMHGSLEHTGYRPMPAQAAWDKAAGSALDAAVLFAGLCRSAGIDAVPVLVSDTRQHTEGKLLVTRAAGMNTAGMDAPLTASKQVPCLQRFTTAGILVADGPEGSKEYTLFDAAGTQNTAAPQALAGVYFMPVDILHHSSTSQIITAYKRERNNSISCISDWSIKTDGTVFGRTAVECTGAFASDYAPDAMGKAVAGALKSAGWGLTTEMESAEALGPDYSKCEVKVESNTAPAMDGFVRFALPAYGHLASKRVKTTSAPRQTPVDFGVAFAEEHLMTLHYPKGMKPVALPEKVELQNAAGSIRSIFIDHGEDIEIIRSIDLPAVVPVENYEDLKAIMNVWNDPARNAVVFEGK